MNKEPLDDSQLDRLVDAGVINDFQANRRRGETDPPEVSKDVARRRGEGAVASVVKRKKGPGPSRRGGRAYIPASDSELDPYYNAPTTSGASEEQSPGDRIGIQVWRESLAFKKLPEVVALGPDGQRAAVDAFVVNRQRELLEQIKRATTEES